VTCLRQVEQVDPIYVNFSPSDEDLLGLRRDIADGRLLMPPAPRALAVQVTLADGSLLRAAGELNFADLASSRRQARSNCGAQLANPQHVLLPGQFVRVRLLGSSAERDSCPQRAVQQGLTGAFVYVVGDSGKVAARRRGSHLLGRRLVASSRRGSRFGERVVVDGVQKVTPGSGETGGVSPSGRQRRDRGPG